MRPNRIKERIAMLLYIILGEIESNAFTDQVGTSPCKTYLQSPLFREQSFTTTLCFDFLNYTIRRIYTAHLFPPRKVQCS